MSEAQIDGTARLFAPSGHTRRCAQHSESRERWRMFCWVTPMPSVTRTCTSERGAHSPIS